MSIIDYRTPAVNSRIADYRRHEQEADARLASVVHATQRFGRRTFGDGDMATVDIEEMCEAAKRAALILVLAAIVFGMAAFAFVHWALVGSFFA